MGQICTRRNQGRVCVGVRAESPDTHSPVGQSLFNERPGLVVSCSDLPDILTQQIPM